MSRKKKKSVWFTKVRGSYLPNSSEGWLTYIPYVGYLVASFFIDIHYSHSLLFVIYAFVSQGIAAGLVMQWIAVRHS